MNKHDLLSTNNKALSNEESQSLSQTPNYQTPNKHMMFKD